MSLPEELQEKIGPGRRVRLAAGAEITSTNPKQPCRVIPRPYWVTLQSVNLERTTITWSGSGGYYYHTGLNSVDKLEDWA